jgi:hypothetical protein
MTAPFFKTLAGKLFAYNDGTYDRASMGDLDAYTGPNGVASPAQSGFRAIDQSGNAIFDSLGLIAVMKQVSTVTGGGSITTDNAVYLPVGPASPVWQVPAGRTQTFLALAFLEVNGSTTQVVDWRLNVSGQYSPIWVVGSTGAAANNGTTLFCVGTFPAGTSVFGQIEALGDGSSPTALLFAQSTISIFLLGG